MRQTKEKLLIENLLSSRDVFSRCIGIIRSDYFDQPEYRPVIKFIIVYFDKYNSLPSFETINAEFDLDFKSREITQDLYIFTCDEIEKFCKQAAFIKAVQESYDQIENNDIDKAYKKVSDAMLVSLERDMGAELYDDPEDYLRKLLNTEINYPTLIKSIDQQLDGGLARKTLTLLSGNSGVGKSNFLANLGANYSIQGLNVIYFTLELPENMIYLRLSAISTAINISLWKQKIPEISSKLINRKNNGAASYIVKRVPAGSNSNDLRSYLKHYELEYKRLPDVIIVDYLDLMYPNGGIKNLGVFDQDKQKSEELTEILHLYNAIGITVSQQNREALRMAAPDQGVIAGGISKVNTVHNYISIIMNDEMLLRGQMFAYFLKTRTSKGKGKAVELFFDANTLIISDPKNEKHEIITKFIGQKNKKNQFNKKITNTTNNVQISNSVVELVPGLGTIDLETGEIIMEKSESNEVSVEEPNDLLKLMDSLGT